MKKREKKLDETREVKGGAIVETLGQNLPLHIGTSLQTVADFSSTSTTGIGFDTSAIIKYTIAGARLRSAVRPLAILHGIRYYDTTTCMCMVNYY